MSHDHQIKNSGAQHFSLRVMTYNVHGCIGMDRRVSPQRIAEGIERHEPDIIALQELDVGRARTRFDDQPHLIAKHLSMHYHFHPNMFVQEGQYGNAILSRYPLTVVKAQGLPGRPGVFKRATRGAIWALLQCHGIQIQFVNTHLDLRRKYRLNQVETLLSEHWLGHAKCLEPVILCGDFNTASGSSTCQGFNKVFRDAQEEVEGHQPQHTWIGHFPMRRLDHVFLRGSMTVENVLVAQSKQDKIASDHLPLIVDLRFVI